MIKQDLENTIMSIEAQLDFAGDELGQDQRDEMEAELLDARLKLQNYVG